MMNDSGKTRWSRSFCALAMMSAVLMSMTACQSPLGSKWDNEKDDRYTEALLNRARFESVAGRRMSSTIDYGVKEFPRIDSPGPANVQIAAAVPAIPGNAPAGGVALATQPSRGQFDPLTMTDDQKILSLDAADLVGKANASLNREEPRRDLTLQEAIMRTMKHSLAIKVEGYTPAIRESQIIEAEAAMDAILFGSSQFGVTDQPPLQDSNPGLQNGWTFQNQLGIRRLLPSGTQVQGTVNLNYREISGSGVPDSVIDALGDRQTSWTANLGLQIVQPLLRGYGGDVTQANIYLAQRDYRISLSQFKLIVSNNAADVEEAYFNVVLAATNVDIQKKLVVASQQTFDNVWERRRLDATKASISQAAQALASRTANLARAQSSLRTASDRLKTLMNDPEFDISSNILINPVDRPMVDPMSYDLEECVDLALRQRPEIQQARLQLERSDIVVTVARNGLLPRLDVTLSAQSNSISGTAAGALGGTVNPSDWIDYGAGIRFEIPIGNREAEGVLRRRINERKQVIDNLMLTAQRAIEEVRRQLREVMTNYEIIQRQDIVRQLAADEFSGIIEIEDIRSRTPEFLQLKLDSQARLANAELDLITAMVNYNLAVMRLEQAKGTLLEYDRISLDRPPTKKDEGLDFLRILGTTWIKHEKPKDGQK